jgi:FkbM family methyltransferase
MNREYLQNLMQNYNNPDVDLYDLIKHQVNIHSEDVDGDIVLNYFAEVSNGKFLIVGAHDGKDHSQQLLSRGWQGVYCEPNPMICSELVNNTEDYRSQVTILNVAITPSGGPIDFYLDPNTSLATTVKNWRESTNLSRKIIVNSMTFTQLFELTGYNFDYVQTDTEGLDIQIIETVDWSKLTQCRMICTEAGPAVLKQLCRQNRFMLTDQTPTNAIYKKNG